MPASRLSPPLTRGVWGVVATPYSDAPDTVNLPVDLRSLRRLVTHYESIGVTGLTVLGVFGEAASLSPAERIEVLRAVIGEVQLPMVVGITALETAAALKEVAAVQDVLGDRLAGAMVQVNDPDPDVVIAHLDAIHGQTGAPIVVQDYPVASGITIATADLLRIVTSVAGVVAVKAENPPTPPAIATLVESGLPVFGGLGGIGLLDELACGSAGAMTGFSYPEALIACVTAYDEGGYDSARAAFAPYLPLVNFEQQAKIALAIREECLRVRGLIDSATVRPPAKDLPPALLPQLALHMKYAEALPR